MTALPIAGGLLRPVGAASILFGVYRGARGSWLVLWRVGGASGVLSILSILQINPDIGSRPRLLLLRAPA